MKKIIIFTLSILFGFSLLWPASSQAASKIYVITPEEGANLTMEPKENSPILKKFKQGDRVEEVKQEEDWLQVRYEGELGYVDAEHVKPLELDLLAAYKHYATILGEYYFYDPAYYTLLHDFTFPGYNFQLDDIQKEQWDN
ncbi:MAG: SH3 domain-containing protein [Solibacillus sp.]